ncbi:MAG: GGDEF domain-containing protein [Hylemonella sp.]|nr:GGDEF domain-containing protein [Hylemonella sp.]
MWTKLPGPARVSRRSPPVQLDPTTLIFLNVVNLLAMSLALPLVMGQNLSPAARLARTSLMLKAGIWVALALTSRWAGLWPDRLLSTLALALMGLSNVLIFRALEHWLGPRPLGRLLVALAVLMPLGFALSFDNYPVRVGWFSLLLTGQLLIMSRAVLLPAPDSNSEGGWRFLMLGCLGVMAVLTATRGILGVIHPEISPSFHTPSPLLLITLVATNVTLVLGNIAILAAWREEAQHQLRTLVITDALTGLFNRNGWVEQAKRALRYAQRYGQPLSLLMIDLDHFKRINDTQGHEAGDAALVFFGGLLRRCQRGGDIIARLGGEEFCVLLAHADTEAAQAFDQRLRIEMANTVPEALRAALDFSTGHALGSGLDETLESLMARADAALYRAKYAGRSQMVSSERAPMSPVDVAPGTSTT